MKKRFFVVFILILVIISTGCKKTIEEKIAENLVEDATGGDVDINKDSTTIKTGSSETKVGNNLKWPKDKMGNLPELKANITTAIEDKELTLSMIYFDALDKDEASKYVGKIKDLGYESVFETSDTNGFMYSGKDEDGSEVIFAYYYDGTGSLSYTDKPFMFIPGQSESATSQEEIDMTDVAPWPKDFVDDFPEIEGKISQLSTIDEQSKYIYVEYVKREDAISYIETLKNAGFNSSISESLSSGYISFEASRDNGDYIVISWSDDEILTINIMKGE